MDRDAVQKYIQEIPGLDEKDASQFVESLDTITHLLNKSLGEIPEDANGLGMEVTMGTLSSKVLFKIAATRKACPGCGGDCHSHDEDGDIFEQKARIDAKRKAIRKLEKMFKSILSS